MYIINDTRIALIIFLEFCGVIKYKTKYVKISNFSPNRFLEQLGIPVTKPYFLNSSSDCVVQTQVHSTQINNSAVLF